MRHRHDDRFTVVGNHLAQHPQLSAVAIGLAVHIRSLPDGSPVSVKALTLRFREGEITIRRAMKELEAAGYIVRERVPLGGGRFATRTFAYDKPGCGTPGGTPDDRPRQAAREPRRAAGQGRTPAQDEPASEPPHRPALPAPPRAAASATHPLVTGSAGPAPSGPAADLLARLRLADHRLLLSARDVAQLVPAVDGWLARGATSVQIARTLAAGLPPEPVPIHHLARFLAHRLRVLLPPPLPAVPAPPEHPAPLRSCDGCERAIRTHDPQARCTDCRRAGAAA